MHGANLTASPYNAQGLYDECTKKFFTTENRHDEFYFDARLSEVI